MRTTINTIYRNINTNLHNIKSDLDEINTRISSGRRLSKISDDPVAMAFALGMRSDLAGISQYQDNLDYGSSIINGSENALTRIKEQISQARVSVLQADNATVNALQRRNIAEAVSNYKEQIISLGNTRIDGKYIFGGHRTSGYTEVEPAPFVPDRIDGYRINGTAPQPRDPDSFTPVGGPGLDALRINGIDIDAAVSDGISSIYPEESAAAKAEAINAESGDTGVTATVTPTYKQAEGVVEEGNLGSGDLIINGVDIFTANTDIKDKDVDNTLINAINDKQEATGVVATRNNLGALLLKAVDGRNLHIRTSASGEGVTRIHSSNLDIPAAANQVYMGRVQLHSEQPFTLETEVPPGGIEYGLEALGLAGGEPVTGEPGDLAGDGLLTVKEVKQQENSVRYAGDRENNLSIKSGRTDTLEVGRNGMDAIMSTGIFATLTRLENYLLGRDFHQVTGIHEAEDLTATLDSGLTGLDGENELVDGSFTVKVTDREHSPPEELEFTIPVDVDQDSLDSVAAKINGIPGMKASWNDDNRLEIAATDPDRYSFTLSEDSSNFLEVTGTAPEEIQMQALDVSLAELEECFTGITTHISDFGARANRIEVQRQIYDNLELKVRENLSDIQDTDYTKAIMELKTAQTAYQAALSSSSKIMQLSLIDYL